MMELSGMLVLAMALSALCGYLLGSVNFAVLVCTRLYGEDVRTKGSGNAGMTNVLRNYGKKGAALTLAGDAGKGVLAVFGGRIIMLLLVPGMDGLFGNTLYGAYVAGIFTIIGHSLPLFFGFKGGKGIATSLGVILALQPVTALILLSIWGIILSITKIVSLASIIGIGCYPVVTLLWCLLVSHKAPVYSTACSAIIAGIVIWMHRGNIQRLRAGTEYRFGQKKKEADEEASSGQNG